GRDHGGGLAPRASRDRRHRAGGGAPLARPGSHADRPGMSPRARLAAGVALAALGLAACGRKGPPVAPEARVPQAVADLAAVVRESAIELTWTNPPRRVDGGPATGALAYEVLRAAAADTELTAVATAAPGQLALTDRELENEHTYYYAVRAVRTEGGTTAYSAPSARVAVTPRKMTPPSPPANLVAIPSESTVRLSWSPSPEPDVSGYVVYRADARGPFVRVGSTRTPTTTFIDRAVPRGTYRYAVAAQDSASLPNQSGRSN